MSRVKKYDYGKKIDVQPAATLVNITRT